MTNPGYSNINQCRTMYDIVCSTIAYANLSPERILFNRWHNNTPLNSVKYIILAVLLSSSPAQARYVPRPVSFLLKLRVTDDGIPELRNQWDYSINSLLDTAGSDIWKKDSWVVQTSSEGTLWSSYSTA